MPSDNKQDLNNLAHAAERDLNDWHNKTGNRKIGTGEDAPGINEFQASKKFPGTEIRYGDDYQPNASYNKKIPVPEGGDRDDKGQ